MNQWNSISLFIIVAELKSFTKAAKQRNLSVMAVSKQIRRLEQYIKQQLFYRTTRQVQLTEFGERYYNYCKAIEKAMDTANEFVRFQQEEIEGELRVFAPPIFAEKYIIPILSDFMDKHPKLTVYLTSGNKIPDLITEKFDILAGLSMSIFPETIELKYRQCFANNYILAASPKYIARYGEPKEPCDLYQHRFIQNIWRPKPMQIKFLNGEELIRLNSVLVLDDLCATHQAATEGIGIVQTMPHYVNHLFQAGKLTLILPNYPLSKANVNIFYKPAYYELKKIRFFIDFLMKKNKKNFMLEK